MPTQSINLGDTDIINFNNQNVNTLQLNGNTIWQGIDSCIYNVTTSTVTPETGDPYQKYFVYVDTNVDGCSVKFQGQTINVPANSISFLVSFDLAGTGSTEISGDIEFAGGFTRISKNQQINVYSSSINSKVNGITRFWNKENVAFEFISDQTINFDINVPNNITEIRLYNVSGTVNLILHNNITFILNPEFIAGLSYDSSTTIAPFGNAQNINNLWIIGDYALCTYKVPSGQPYVVNIPENIKLLSYYCFGGTDITQVNFNQNNLVTKIPAICFSGCSSLTTLTIPSNINEIGNRAFSSNGISMYLTSIRFEQPFGMSVTLGTELFKSKSAESLTVYTDNETIRNYNYSGDNITATILHLDGTPW